MNVATEIINVTHQPLVSSITTRERSAKRNTTKKERWESKSSTTKIIESQWGYNRNYHDKWNATSGCQDNWYYPIRINVKQKIFFFFSFKLSNFSYIFSLSPFLSFFLSFPLSHLVQLYVWLGTGVENRSQSKRGRAHLHDMNIMERAGSPANSGCERALPVELRARGSLVTHRMCPGCR